MILFQQIMLENYYETRFYEDGYRLFDLHTHTYASRCSLNSTKIERNYLKRLEKTTPLTIAITDHNVFTKTDFAIPGEEIKTNQGEVIGLFISEEIKPWKDAVEIIDEIHEQGGISIIAHPYDKIRRDAMKTIPDEVLKKVDMLEVANGRSLNSYRKKAKQTLIRSGLLPSAGSDGHFLWELGDSGLFLKLGNDVSSLDSKEFLNAVRHSWEKHKWRMIKENNETFSKLVNMLGSGIISRSRLGYRVFRSRLRGEKYYDSSARPKR